MLMYFVSGYYRDQLCDPRKEQVGMQGFLILCPLPRNAETAFELVDVFFNVPPDLISIYPFGCTSQDTRVSAEILFGIKVEHSSTGRVCTGVFTVADTFGFTGGFVILPLHFRTNKFHGRKTAAQMGFASLPFHGKGRVFGTAWDPVFIKGAVRFLQ